MSVVTQLLNPTLESVQQAFDHWRTTRVNRSRTPISLQHRAAALLDSYPASHICRALKINDTALKRWSRAANPTPMLSPVDSSAFIELPAAPESKAHSDTLHKTLNALSIELSDAIQLRVHGEFTLEQILQAARAHEQGVRS